MDIEKICNSNHQEFVTSVNHLLHIREGTVVLTSEILNLAQSIQTSTEKLAGQKKALVESRSHRQNIDETSRTLDDCLKVLRLANQVHDLLARKSHYAALRALDELQHVHLKGVTQYRIAEMIQRSIPATQRAISEAVMLDLNTWLFRIREVSQYLGEIALSYTERRKNRQNERADVIPYLRQFKLNSAIELVADEHEEYDLLQNEALQVDFSPLFECLYIHQSLGQMDNFRSEYAMTRRHQKDLLLPTSIVVIGESSPSLLTLLEEIAGFAIIERSTMKRIPNLRSPVDVGFHIAKRKIRFWWLIINYHKVDELWDSMCQSAVSLISKSLVTVDHAESILEAQSRIVLFIQAMNVRNCIIFRELSRYLTCFTFSLGAFQLACFPACYWLYLKNTPNYYENVMGMTF